ncbi:hypothetical protein EII17_09610 [Clostridiales bacterium COT073_COT-073]|nr:hypothetical protein EII17_09610 [Clostridiales bacterium COT073_COT-073]
MLSNQIETDELSYDMIGVFQAYTNQPLIEEINEDTVGVLKQINPNDPVALWNIGYNILDVSGDQIPELIIGSVEMEEGGYAYGRNIYALYTLIDKEPQFVLAGTAREKQFYLGNGKFYHNYVGNPLDEVSGIYKLSRDGMGVKYLDYYFIHEKSENSNKLGYFHNKVGESDPKISKELKISESEFEELLAKISDQIKRIRFIPFYEYSEDSLAEFDSIRIHVDYSTEEELKYAFDYDSFNVEDEDTVKVTFTTNEMVADFRILELKNGEVDENGKESFVIEEVYGMDVLDPNRPFIVGVHFAGLIPNNGISFTDEDGNTRTFMLYPSGEDGSLILQEVE